MLINKVRQDNREGNRTWARGETQVKAVVVAHCPSFVLFCSVGSGAKNFKNLQAGVTRNSYVPPGWIGRRGWTGGGGYFKRSRDPRVPLGWLGGYWCGIEFITILIMMATFGESTKLQLFK